MSLKTEILCNNVQNIYSSSTKKQEKKSSLDGNTGILFADDQVVIAHDESDADCMLRKLT